MDKFLGLPDTAWTGIYTIITFGLLVVAVVAALYAKKQGQIAREQAADARKAQMEASRPYVTVTIEPSGADWHLFDLVVKNIGARTALGVSIALDPPPMRASEMAGHEIANAKMLNEPVAMTAPGQEMRTFSEHMKDATSRSQRGQVVDGMAKSRQKIYGNVHTLAGVEHIAALLSYIATTSKRDLGALQALTMLTAGNAGCPRPRD